jgi:beta-N-acetylhexosaminidase
VSFPDPSRIFRIHTMALSRRSLLHKLTTWVAAPALFGARDALAAPHGLSAQLREMLMLGFDGPSPDGDSARWLADQIAAGRVGGVLFVHVNVGTRDEVSELLGMFSPPSVPPVFLAIDHEGGIVQRLSTRHGVTPLRSALSVCNSMSVDEARKLYAAAGREVSAVGFNLNLAPVVDLHDPENPAIGKYGRAFSADPEIVARYAEAFIDGFASAGILCALKHFPGHGRSQNDSHHELPDITKTWSAAELEPYQRLIANDRAHAVMGGHLHLGSVDSDLPTTLSKPVTTGILRGRLGFRGVAMTDDLDMAAIPATNDRRDIVIKAIQAGNDILMIKNVTRHDPDLPDRIEEWVSEAINGRILDPGAIRESAARVRLAKSFTAALKKKSDERP